MHIMTDVVDHILNFVFMGTNACMLKTHKLTVGTVFRKDIIQRRGLSRHGLYYQASGPSALSPCIFVKVVDRLTLLLTLRSLTYVNSYLT